MIHVCSLARLHSTVTETRARRIVTLMKDVSMVKRPESVLAGDHLLLDMDDISEPIDGYVLPGETHVTQLIDFVMGWDRAAPLVVHCYAGISRSTAGAFITACALNPGRDEHRIARLIREASPTAQPNIRLVSLADRALGRKGRMIEAVMEMGPAATAYEGVPFRLDLE
ncbi:MAG: protein tyrosine phosphatase [Pseudorhodoplanes sp.]|nr:protein tyrosine phosphatase [Pseudorhodoplanes sp.]